MEKKAAATSIEAQRELERKILRDAQRGALLEQINSECAKRGLRTFRKLGDVERGEPEITGIEEWMEGSKPWVTDVRLSVTYPNPDPAKRFKGTGIVRKNAKGAISDGAVIVPMINGRFGIVKQWRYALGMYTYEVPRGFGESMDKAKVACRLGSMTIGDTPLGTGLRELGEEFFANAKITSVTHLGNIAENTGTHDVFPSHYLIQISAPYDKINSGIAGSDNEIKEVQLWDRGMVEAEMGNKLCDNHTLTALALTMMHIKRLSGR